MDQLWILARISDCACLDVRILGPKPEIWIIDLSSAMVGMLMSSFKLFLFSHEAHLNSSPVHPYPNIFENGDFFPYLKKNSRPQEYDRYLVWRAFSKSSIFVVENAVYVWEGGVNGKKSLRLWKYPDTCGRGLRCETASGIVLCYSRQACCLLCCLCHINNSSHNDQFTFELLLLCLRMWLWFQIWTKIFADRRIWHRFAYPYPLPSTVD